MTFYTREELSAIGFGCLGAGVKVSRLASIHNPGAIEIGDESRIDDFCVLSAGVGGIYIGRHVHIAAYSSLQGAGRIDISDYANVSSRVAIYSSNDDYSGRWMTNPTVPARFTNVSHDPVRIESHVIVGAGAVVLPGVTLARGAGIGALSLVRTDCEALGIYVGSPARLIGRRASTMFDLQRELEAREQSVPPSLT